MPTVSAGDLLLLRADGHKSDVYTSFLPNIILWEARINDGSIVQGETSIDFDAGTGSFYSLIEALQEVWVGSAAEANDVGRLRIKSISSGDGGVTGTVTVAGHSLPLEDDDYLTFHHNYPLKPRYSWVDPSTEIWYMDDDVVYTDQHEEPPPIVIAGPHRGGFLVAGSFVINVNSSSSYAVAAGASISSYALTVASTAGTPTVNFNTGTGLGDITFTDPGDYWAKYTVTDSNGKSQVSYRWYFVCEKDRSSAFHPFVDSETITLTGDWETGGWIAGIEAKDGYSLDKIPFHTLCVIWRESWYGATKKAITFLPDSATTIFAGYVRGEVEEQDFEKGLGHVDLVLSTVEGRLRRMYSFSASIVANTPVNHWKYGPNWMTVGIIAAYLLRWRSTIFEVTDVLGLKDNTWLEAGFEPDDNNLYDMINNYALDEGIRAKLVCDKGGRLILSYDNQLLIDSERSALLTTFDIKKDPDAADYGGALIVARAPEPEAPFVTSNGVYWDGTTYDEDGRPEATGDWCVIAPGGKPLHEGPNPMDFPAQIIPSLDYLKQLAGRYLAKANNEIEEVRIAFSGDYLGVLEVAYDNSVFTLSLQASDMPRGVAWNAKPLYLRNVTARFSGATGLFECNASFEPEAAGITGIETQCPSFPLLGGEIVPIPIPEAAPGALLTGSSVHQKLATENAWLELHTEDVDDLIVDPFWKLKTSSFSPSDAIVFRSGLGYIERSTDGGVTFSDVTPTTDPPNDSSDSPAPTVANVRFNRLDASFTSQHEFVALCTWQNASSEWRTWIYHSDDNFATNGTWLSISSGFGATATWDTPTIYVTNGEGVYPQNSWSQLGNIKGIAQLTPTKFVVCFRQDYGDPGDNDYSGYARIVEVNQITGTLVIGSKYGPFNNQEFWNPPTNTIYNEIHGIKVFAWDSSHFVILAHQTDGEFWPPNETCNGTPGINGWALIGYVGSVSGRTITFGDPQLIQNETICCADDQETICRDFYPNDFDMCRLPGSGPFGVIISSHWLVGENYQKNPGYAWVVLVNGGQRTMSVGEYQQWEACITSGCRPSPGIGCNSHKVVGIDSYHAAIFYNTNHDAGDGAMQAYVKHVTVSTALKTCVFGSHQWLPMVGPGGDKAWGLDVAKLTSTKFVLTSDPTGLESVHSTVVTRVDDTYTVVSQGTVNGEEDFTPWWPAIPSRISDTMWSVVWLDWSGSAARINGRVGYETSPTSHAYGTRVQFTELSDDPARYREFATPGAASGYDFTMAVFDDQEDYGLNEDYSIRAVKLDYSIDGYETKGLGISFGKGLGNRIWVTVWTNTNGLELINVELPSMVESGRFSLGAATEAQVNAKSLIAYPFNAYGSDDICIVYGRMDSPQDSESIEHVIVTQDAGSSFASVENGWGADHAGALYFSSGGIMFVMRNRYNQSKLYKDEADSNLILKSTMPFEARVAPHGMYVNPSSGDVYAASWEADAVMVAIIAPPYFTPRDLTYNHDNSEGVQSIVEL